MDVYLAEGEKEAAETRLLIEASYTADQKERWKRLRDLVDEKLRQEES